MSSHTIAIVGVGSIGNVIAKALSKEDFNLILIDRDIVEEHNLKNQQLYSEEDVSKPKAIVAKEKLKGKITAYCEDLTFKNINLLNKADLILDCTDNLETRFLINDFALKNERPWIYSAAIRNQATTMNFLPGGVCFRCIFKHAHGLDTCETQGITNEITEKLSKLVVENAKKILSGRDVSTEMIRMTVASEKNDSFPAHKRETCPACNGEYEYLEGEKITKAIKLCGGETYQIKGSAKIEGDYEIRDKITLFKDGRALIKAKSEEEARMLYSKFVGN